MLANLGECFFIFSESGTDTFTVSAVILRESAFWAKEERKANHRSIEAQSKNLINLVLFNAMFLWFLNVCIKFKILNVKFSHIYEQDAVKKA
jgi:hypothetical protein